MPKGRRGKEDKLNKFIFKKSWNLPNSGKKGMVVNNDIIMA